MKYCHLCGARYVENQQQPWVCSSCGNKRYLDAAPAVELVLVNGDGALLITQRGNEPNRGSWDLPGGFVDYGEVLEQALFREIQEEIGLDVDDVTKPQYVCSWVGEYAFSKETTQTLSTVFVAKLLTNKKIQAKDDVANVKFINESDFEAIDFSYQGYPEIITQAIALVRDI